jgi:hypothetical protein
MRIGSSGNINLQSFAGTGIGIVMVDASGNLIPFRSINPENSPCGVGTANPAAWQYNESGNLDFLFNCWQRFGLYTQLPRDGIEIKGQGIMLTSVNDDADYLEISHDGANSRITNFGSGNLLINYSDDLAHPTSLTAINTGSASGDIYLGNNNKKVIMNGIVGIGTNTPTEKLEIDHYNPSPASSGMVLDNISSDNKNSEIKFNSNGNLLWALGNNLFHSTSSSEHNFFIFNELSYHAPFYINEEEKTFIGFSALPVSHALLNSIYKLYVDGGIATRDVKVTSNSTWPDYVFKDNYKPMSLKELENYLIINKHLPDMPAADAIQKNEGFEVGDLQTKLLKTVEEQTLYIISLQKQIDEMKKKMNELTKK